MNKYNLHIDFDFVDKDNYYEVMIQSQNAGKKGLYLTVGTEKGAYFVTSESYGEPVSSEYMMKNEIIKLLIDGIKMHYR